ncbi:MAG: FHA domain-containing protein [Actinomycetota bacterium]|nr:FHA domain-containing protein [Actinomycetota bacterium]
MSPQLIRLLTICLLLLIYLFFFRVLRAVWVGVRPAREMTPRRTRAAKPHEPPSALVVRTPETQQGLRHAFNEEITLGRAAGCDVTIDDSYASQIHARVFRRDDNFLLEDLGSTNGTYLNRQNVTTATVLKSGDQIQVGSTVYEVAT